jgi:hypothetical protein
MRPLQRIRWFLRPVKLIVIKQAFGGLAEWRVKLQIRDQPCIELEGPDMRGTIMARMAMARARRRQGRKNDQALPSNVRPRTM